MGDSEGLVLAIDSKADSTTQKRRTMKLLGKIGKEQILILVDSGSIGTLSVLLWYRNWIWPPPHVLTPATNQPVEVLCCVTQWYYKSVVMVCLGPHLCF